MIDFYDKIMLTKSDLMGLNECFAPIEREYARGEIITICSPDYDTIGIITKGIVYLSTNNIEEQRRIIDYYTKGDMFGTSFPPNIDTKAFYIIAKTNCKVNFIKYKKLISCCEKSCAKHIAVINNLVLNSIKKQMLHIDIIGQRTLRSKLLTYFDYMSNENNNSSFTLPLPLSDLADFLAVDRSAMMREIKKLNDENIIESNKRKITIL